MTKWQPQNRGSGLTVVLFVISSRPNHEVKRSDAQNKQTNKKSAVYMYTDEVVRNVEF